MSKTVDKPFLIITSILVVVGVVVFISASIGLFAREGVNVSSQIVSQILALVIGLVAAYLVSKINTKFWNKYSFYIFLGSIILTLLVFVPFLGFEHAGARRWLSIGSFTLQPAEFLKFAFILYYGAWCAGVQRKIHDFKFSLFPLLVLLGVVGVVLALQPDFGTLIIIGVTALAMLVSTGAKWKHILSLCLTGIIFVSAIGFSVPYVKDRLLTFLQPERDPLGAGYQIQQSLIAIGSGKVFGRGAGQSVQKFNFLPEPIGDSIFAVFAEEWGFVGGIVLVSLFVLFASRGFRISTRAPNTFSRLVVVGFITAITAQSFINMGSMLGIFPLTGDPLVFVSQGGTSILVTLIEVGIILAISKASPAV